MKTSGKLKLEETLMKPIEKGSDAPCIPGRTAEANLTGRLRIRQG